MRFEDRFASIEQMFELAIDNKDPGDTVLICRSALEKTIDLIFDIQGISKPTSAQLLELINHETVQDFLGNDILVDALHFVRIVGINALHGKHIKRSQAKVAIDNTEYLLATVKSKISPSKGIFADVSVLSDQKVESLSVPASMTEFETRKVYIDLYLNEAGWEVVPPTQKTKLPNGKEVASGSIMPGKACSEIMVDGLPHGTGIGFCDYVLYGRNGKPLAIVEAKRTSEQALKGQQQVRQYGNCMKTQYGYVPVLYYTNGYDIFIIDGKYAPRKIAAFHTLDELEYLIQKRSTTRIIDTTIDTNIAGRPYQNMAITAICDRFNNMYRRSLLVMATGTGKTRTAIALVELLFRNKWIKNVLFLADRTSLVKQAFKNFKKLLPDYTYNVVSDQRLANDANARVTFSTHQTMINCIDSEEKEFTVGRFDLIIIDEAHRSIFNKFGAIFSYFDCLLVGLTATPKEEVDANTYALFNCESGIPNFSYSLEEAVRDHYLVSYKLINRKVKSLKSGILYKDLSDRDKATLALLTDSDYDDDTVIKTELFKKIYNIDSCRKVLDDLMTMGLRIEQGQVIGKTIIFAVNHFHAEMIVNTFNEMYPMFPEYCKLIDNRVKNSEDLIDEFETDPKFRIAVSVDMLDTGIDIPEVLNLVFFKKINSEIKLVQMIGRGTRLCEGLIDGKDKQCFFIFDYFNNFKEKPDDSIAPQTTIAQKLFTIRLEMLCLLQKSEHQLIPEQKQYHEELKNLLIKSVKYLKANGSGRIAVREEMDAIDKYCDDQKWEYISSLEEKELTCRIVPIIESDISEEYLCLSFDNKMLKIELSFIKEGDLSKIGNIIKAIRTIARTLLDKASIMEISEKITELQVVYSEDFWKNAKLDDMEHYRKEIRHLMKYLREEKVAGVMIDHEDETIIGDPIESPFIDIRTYKERVLDYLLENSNNPTILKIKNLEPLGTDDFDYLEDILWVQLGSKEDYYSISKIDNLAAFIRSIVGIEQEAVNKAFSEYLSENYLSPEQQEFIYSIINYVRENGDVEPQVLIEESPFDHFDILSLFGNNIPIVNNVVSTLHNCIAYS
ncbi:MAG: DEAD/DEAH box helicase family protein [Erysipelotrichaceae bacterium]|nr:DEAD/DEAH box helicase family protein [Erysipelotrichaceae bacterium]